MHHHVVPPRFADDSMPIKLPDTEAQLRSMDSWHIRAAITSLTPRVVLKNINRLRDVSRDCNEFQARMAQDHPSRLGAFALLPLPDVDGTLEEISYALDVLRLDGVGLFSSVNDRYLGDPSFDPVFDELNRRKAVVFIHPTHCEAPEHTGLHAPPFVVEYVFDTTRAIVNLVFTGTLKRCPDICFIVAHGGGAVPFLAQRIAMMEGHRGAKMFTGVLPALRALFYETASTTFGIRPSFVARACRSGAHSVGLGLAVRLRCAIAGGNGSLGALRWLRCRRPSRGRATQRAQAFPALR